MSKRVIICKDEDSNKYEVWEKIENGVLDNQFIDVFDDMNVCIKFCEDNNFKIERDY